MVVYIFELVGNEYVKVAEIRGSEIIAESRAIKRFLKEVGVVDEESALKKLGRNFYLHAVKVSYPDEFREFLKYGKSLEDFLDRHDIDPKEFHDFLFRFRDELRKSYEKDKTQYGDEFAKFLALAGEYFEKINPRLAVEFYDECSNVYDELAKVYICYLHDSEKGIEYAKKSVEFCEKILKLGFNYPQYYIALQNLGMAYYENHESEKAIPIFKKLEKMLKDANYPLKEIYPIVLANLSLCYADVKNEEEAVEYVLKFACFTYKEYGEIDVETVKRVVEMIGKNNDAYLLLLLIDFTKFRKSISEVLEELENIKTERAKKIAKAIEECKPFEPVDDIDKLFLKLLRIET